MEQSSPLLQKSKSYLRYGILVFLILFAAKFVRNDALPYFGLDKETFGDFWDYRWPLIGHISGGLLALAIGPFQFWKRLRDKYITIHRLLGRVYLIAILLGTISATYLAWTSSIRLNFSWALALQVLAFAWITPHQWLTYQSGVGAFLNTKNG